MGVQPPNDTTSLHNLVYLAPPAVLVFALLFGIDSRYAYAHLVDNLGALLTQHAGLLWAIGQMPSVAGEEAAGCEIQYSVAFFTFVLALMFPAARTLTAELSLRKRCVGAAVGLGTAMAWTVLLFGPWTDAEAQIGEWSQPHDFGPYWFPDIAADATGRVHVVWSSGEPGFDQVKYSTSADGVEWSPPIDIFALPQSGSFVSRPSIVAGPDGDLHLGFRNATAYFSQSRARTGMDPHSWVRPVEIATGAYFTRLAMDSHGRLHFFYTQNYPDELCGDCFHLLHRFSDDDGTTWSPAHDFVFAQGGTAKPQVVIDGDDNLVLAWESGLGGDLGRLSDPATVMVATSNNRGESWSIPTGLDPRECTVDSGMSRNVALGLAPNDTIVAVWLRIPEDEVRYSISADAGYTWSDSAVISDIVGTWHVYNDRSDNYAMVADSLMASHLVMAGRRSLSQSGIGLYHLIWNGEAWSVPELIQSYQGDAPEWPRVAIANGNKLHVAWFVRNQEAIYSSDTGDYRVYHSAKWLDVPATTQALEFSHENLATTPSFRAQTAATATLQARSPPKGLGTLPGAMRTPPPRVVNARSGAIEQDGILLILLALLPAAAVVILALSWRRR
jgi:hypothetical protein